MTRSNLFKLVHRQWVHAGRARRPEATTLNFGKDPDKNYNNLEKANAKLLKNYSPELGM
jgi:hypothetical protein